jgi:tetratricopeptide (TPR) repeat protein
MFFMRLRRHAKSVFLVLAGVFAFTFLFAGVGTGTGAGDLIQQLLGMRGSDPVKSAENDVKDHPRNLQMLISLAQLYQSKGREDDAVTMFERALKVNPRSTTALTQLGQIWQQRADARWQTVVQAQAAYQDASGVTGGGLLGSDPLRGSAAESAYQELETAYLSYMIAGRAWVQQEQRLEQASGKNVLEKAPAELRLAGAAVTVYQNAAQLGRAADVARERAIALTALKTYLRVAPKGADAKAVRSAVKQLEKASPAG